MNSTNKTNTAANAKQLAASFVQNYTGNNFVNDVAAFLADTLKVDYVLIGKLQNQDCTSVETVSLYAKGGHAGQMVYKLHGTPCENVVGRNLCYYPKGVQDLFPDDKELADLGIESYIGSPLFDEKRQPMGLIVLMHSQTIPNPENVQEVLQEVTKRTEEDLRKASVATNQ